MSNVLEFYIKLKDMMSSGLASVAKVAKEKGAQIVSVFKGVEDSIDKATAKNKKFADSFDDVEKRGKSLNQVMKGLGIGLSVASLVAFTKDSLAQSAEAESARIAFKVLTGDKFKGDALYGNIRKMADTTPYESQELMRSGKMLLGFGEKQSNIMPDLKSLGDIAAAQEDSKQALLGLSHAYGEVIASGRLLGRNTLEMINWGFNPLKEISIMTGKSMAKLKEEEERGAISAEMVRKAFEHATAAGGKYHNMMEEQATTLSGRWSTFMDLVHAKMRSFGDLLAPVAKTLLELSSNILNLGAPSEFEKFVSDTDHLRALRTEYSLINTSNERRAEIFRELKATYPDVVANIRNEKDAIDKLLPSLDGYINKRYYAAGQAAIKDRYKGDLQAIAEANAQMQITAGQALEKTIDIAGKYGIATGGSSGQLMIRVQKELQYQKDRLKDLQYSSGEKGGKYFEANKDLQELQDLIAANKEAQQLWKSHISGANKAKEAVEQFNKIMGIKPDAPGGAAKAAGSGEASAGDDITGGIARGGPRVININGGVKFADKFEMHVTEFKGGVEQVKEVFDDMLLRVLNSGATVQQ